MTYSSKDNVKIKQIKKLTQKKYRDLDNLFLVEGEHLVTEAYNSGYLNNLIILEDYDFPISKNNIVVTDKIMNYISQLDSHQNVIGICTKIKQTSYTNKILIVDGVQDPGNLGTIIRSAVAFNFKTIILSPDTVDLYNSKVIRASQGMIFHCNIVIKDICDEIQYLEKLGYFVCATKVDNGNNLEQLKSKDKLAVIVGNEGNGVSDKVLDKCRNYVHINMNKECESLNVGVATSIIMYELSK